jgi:hypothetical protein
MPLRHAHAQPLADRGPATSARHCCRCPSFVYEDKPILSQIDLAFEPSLSSDQDVRSILLEGVRGLYGMARPSSPAQVCIG